MINCVISALCGGVASLRLFVTGASNFTDVDVPLDVEHVSISPLIVAALMPPLMPTPLSSTRRW